VESTKALLCLFFGVFLVLKWFFLFLIWSFPLFSQTPLTDCGQINSLSKKPHRVLTFDINTTEMILALGEAKRLIGISGVWDTSVFLPRFQQSISSIPLLSPHYLPFRQILKQRPDFVVGGWNLGFFKEGQTTPQNLAKEGIGSYSMRESCIHVGDDRPVTLKSAVYEDLRNLGSIFGRENKAESLINKMETTLDQVRKGYARLKERNLKVFVFDSGPFRPYTIGDRTVLNDLISLAGAQNIFREQKASWFQTSWDEVSLKNPDIVIIVDYGDVDGQIKLNQLKETPLLKKTKALQHNHFIIIPYSASISGIRSASLALSLQNQMQCLMKKVKPNQNNTNGGHLCSNL